MSIPSSDSPEMVTVAMYHDRTEATVVIDDAIGPMATLYPGDRLVVRRDGTWTVTYTRPAGWLHLDVGSHPERPATS